MSWLDRLKAHAPEHAGFRGTAKTDKTPVSSVLTVPQKHWVCPASNDTSLS